MSDEMMQTVTFWIYSGIVIIAFVGLLEIIWSERQKQSLRATQRRGTAPGRGGTVLYHSGFDQADGTPVPGSSRAWTVPKDPQQYAKGFVPGNRNRND
ncbi:hypothetical protein [Nioella aestuarii]|uniref:hypothetical protein n=1 Tax=Nioella aestuarii TaxID=1662864 RepID=UPI003D7FD6C6